MRTISGRATKSSGFKIPLLLITVLLADVANAANNRRTDIAPLLGQGYDSITGQLRNTCVGPVGRSTETPVNIADLTINHVTDAFQLSNLSEVGLAFAYKAATGSGNGSLSWLENRSLSTFVETFFVQSSFVRTESAQRFDLLPRFRRLQRTDPLQFRRVCGDSFVASFRTGATIRGTITFSTRSEAEAQGIGADARVEAAGSSASAAALLSTIASRNAADLS